MKKSSLRTKIALLSISMFFMSGISINGALPQIRDHFGMSQSQSEILMVGISISKIFALLLADLIAKKIGMKKACTGGLFFIGFAGLLPFLSQQFTVILASRLLFGVGLGLFNSLAIRYITALYEGRERSVLLGVRGSVEGAGVVVLTILAGLLMNISWHLSFGIFLLAWPVALFFYLNVPEIDDSQGQAVSKSAVKEKLPPGVYGIALLSVAIVINLSSIALRFPALSMEVMGEDFNASYLIAIKPVFLIVAGAVFGKLKHRFGRNIFYYGILSLVLANVLVMGAGGSLWLLAIGSGISQICTAWSVPFIVEELSDMTTENNFKLAMSIFLIGTNIGNFLSPMAMGLFHTLLRREDFSTPFYAYSVISTLILLGVVLKDKITLKKEQKATV